MLVPLLYVASLLVFVFIYKCCDFRSLYLLWKHPKVKKFIFVPFLGHLGFLKYTNGTMEGFNDIVTVMTNETGKMLFCMGYKAISFYKPDHMEIVLKHPATQNKAYFYDFLKDVLGNSLLCLNGKEWQTRRKIVRPVMKSNVIASFVEEISRYSELMADQFKPHVGKTFNAGHEIAKHTVDMITKVLIGIENVENDKCVTCAKTITQTFLLRSVSVLKQFDFIFKWTKESKLMNDAIVYSQRLIRENINNAKIANYGNTLTNKADIENTHISQCHRYIDFLISSQLSDHAVSHEATLLIAAGFDTTQTTISFALIMIAMHPDIQEKLYQEVLEILGPDRTLEHSDIAKFVYLRKVIDETLRLFPSVPSVARLTTDEVTIDGNTIPKNTNIMLSVFTLHRSPLYWPDPLKFDPERFSPEAKRKRPNNCFIPFLAGNRNCFGAPFATMTIITTLAILLQRYQWHTPYKCVTDIQLELGVILTCKNSVLLRPEKRQIL